MGIPDRYNPKKWIGSLGRRYGGRPFQVVRKFYYDTLSLGAQCYETLYLARGSYAPGHRDSRFLARYYSRDNRKLGEKGVNGIICMLDGRRFHGGITDRLRGILTTYREARKRGLPFYIYWNDPFPLSEYLEPASVDWRIEGDSISYNPSEAFPVVIEDETNLQSAMRMKAGLRLKFRQLHLYSNADNAIGEYAGLYRELFRPSRALQAEIDRHMAVLGEKYWSFTFRFLNLLGDFKEWERRKLSDEEAEKLMSQVIEVMKREMLELPDGYRVLVTADSRRFLDRVKDVDPRIYVVPGDVKNVDLLKGEYKGAWMKTFTDHRLIMNARRAYLVRTGRMYKSGFPRFAAEVGGAEFIDLHF